MLSYLVTPDGAAPAALSVMQAGQVRPAHNQPDGSFAVDADPTAGDAVE